MDDNSRANRALTEVSVSPAPADSPHPALELRGITKHFGIITVLDDVSLSAQRGSIHALLGENGAGKTTLMRIAFGMLAPDAGLIVRDGKVLGLRSPADAIAARIGMVHQQFSLIPAMTVAENVALGGKGIYRFEDIAQRIEGIAKTAGLVLDPRSKVADLTNAERQRLEIVRTLAHDAAILILDEPTAILTERDTGELFEQLRLFADAGGSVILITHKLRDALDHADEVSVLRHGQLVLNTPMLAVTQNALATAMLGDTPHVSPGKRSSTAPAFGSTVVARVKSPPVEVFAGEILGIAALEGAAGALLRSFAGRTRPDLESSGTSLSVGFVPENRQEEALIPDFSLTENVALKNAGDRRGLIDWEKLHESTGEIIRHFDVHTSGSSDRTRNLSGGNQQRFVLGRELSDDPSLLVLENPTQGLDVSAAAAVHERMRAARDKGTAIVFYSSDLDELADLSDRVFVLGAGAVAITSPDREEIGRALLGVGTPEHAVA